MKIQFRVDDTPPRKYGKEGALSMWGTSEAYRLATLRLAAYEKMNKLELKDYFRTYIKIELTMFVPLIELESIGDLDNFISGICDGLQKAPCKATIHELFQDPIYEETKTHPRYTLLIENDSKVVNITASKMHFEEGCEVKSAHYSVAIEQAD